MRSARSRWLPFCLLLGILTLLPLTAWSGQLLLMFDPATVTGQDGQLGPLPDGSLVSSDVLLSVCSSTGTEIQVFDPATSLCASSNEVNPSELPDSGSAVDGTSQSVDEVLASGQLVVFTIRTGSLCIPSACIVISQGDFFGSLIGGVVESEEVFRDGFE